MAYEKPVCVRTAETFDKNFLCKPTFARTGFMDIFHALSYTTQVNWLSSVLVIAAGVEQALAPNSRVIVPCTIRRQMVAPKLYTERKI